MTNETDDMAPIKDLFDFYQRWSDLRPRVAALIASDRLDRRERMILTSMVALVDRVGPDDLSVTDESD